MSGEIKVLQSIIKMHVNEKICKNMKLVFNSLKTKAKVPQTTHYITGQKIGNFYKCKEYRIAVNKMRILQILNKNIYLSFACFFGFPSAS